MSEAEPISKAIKLKQRVVGVLPNLSMFYFHFEDNSREDNTKKIFEEKESSFVVSTTVRERERSRLFSKVFCAQRTSLTFILFCLFTNSI